VGYRVEIGKHFKDYNVALEEEIRLIAFYKRKVDGGILCNITKGGEGFRNKHTEASKKKMSVSQTGLKRHFSKKILKKLKNLTKNRFSKKVYQYNLDGKYLKSWSSVTKASQSLGCQFTGISAACRETGRDKSCGGFLWSYENLPKLPPYKRKKAIVVNQYNLNGEFINTFKSASEATKFLGKNPYSADRIIQCCRGDVKTCWKYIWKFG